MVLEEIAPICSNCGAELKKIKGKYGEFYGCPNYLECGFKGYPVGNGRPKDKPQPRRETPTDLMMIMEQLTTLDKGLREIWVLLIKIQEKLNDK